MNKPRFKKGQEIFKIEVHNNKPTGYSKKTIKSCGIKQLILFGDHSISDKYNPNKKVGSLGNLILTFHATEKEAINEIKNHQ